MGRHIKRLSRRTHATNKHLEQLVEQAATTKSDKDYASLVKALVGVELYFNVKGTNREVPSGPVTVGEEADLRVEVRNAGDALYAVVFYASSDNKALKKPYAGIPWERALSIVAKMPEAVGLVIQSPGSDWVALSKEGVLTVLERGSVVERRKFLSAG